MLSIFTHVMLRDTPSEPGLLWRKVIRDCRASLINFLPCASACVDLFINLFLIYSKGFKLKHSVVIRVSAPVQIRATFIARAFP